MTSILKNLLLITLVITVPILILIVYFNIDNPAFREGLLIEFSGSLVEAAIISFSIPLAIKVWQKIEAWNNRIIVTYLVYQLGNSLADIVFQYFEIDYYSVLEKLCTEEKWHTDVAQGVSGEEGMVDKGLRLRSKALNYYVSNFEGKFLTEAEWKSLNSEIEDLYLKHLQFLSTFANSSKYKNICKQLQIRFINFRHLGRRNHFKYIFSFMKENDSERLSMNKNITVTKIALEQWSEFLKFLIDSYEDDYYDFIAQATISQWSGRLTFWDSWRAFIYGNVYSQRYRK
jgi:hypothetical protein